MDFSSSSSSDSDGDEILIQAAQLTLEFMGGVLQLITPQPLRRGPHLERNRLAAHDLLVYDYFRNNAMFGPKHFRRRYRMSKRLFLRITQDLENAVPFFKQKTDARGKLGFSAIQKCTSAIRQIAYGTTSDAQDEYLKMSEKVSCDSLEPFCKGIIDLYRKRYLRRPSWSDIQQIYEVQEAKHGLPGMLGSIDCTHWPWENCPIAWKGQHKRGDHPGPSIMLEAVASHDTWIWHAFFGTAGSNNDINDFYSSPVFNDIVDGVAPGQVFYVNDQEYKRGYYLTDGIYPEWGTIVKAFSYPHDDKRKLFKKKQESARKDIERTFGVLKRRWAIIKNLARMWAKEKIRDVMYAVLILHNMILEDEGKANCQSYEGDVPRPPCTITNEERLRNIAEIRSHDLHNALRADLVEHLWTYHQEELYAPQPQDANDEVEDDDDDDDNEDDEDEDEDED